MTNPFGLFFLSFLLAWIYLIIPNHDYWTYTLIRNQWWAIITLYSYIESMEIYMPGISDNSYVLLYVAGFLSPPLIRTVAFFCKVQDNYFMNVFAATSIVIAVVIIFGVAHSTLPSEEEQQGGDKSAPMNAMMRAVSNVSCNDRNGWTREEESSGHSIEMSTTSAFSNVLHTESVESPLIFNRKMMTLPELMFTCLPRHWYNVWKVPSLREPGLITNSSARRWQWLLCTIFLILCNVYYLFLMSLTLYFRAFSADRTTLFVVFVFVGTFLRLTLKRLGMEIDKYNGRGQQAAMYVGEILGLVLYFMFYRVLFESIQSWELFFIFQAIHLISEWIIYPFRSSKHLLRLLRNQLGHIWLLKGTFVWSEEEETDFLRRVVVDFGLRTVVMISTGIGALVLFASIAYLPWISNELLESKSKLLVTTELIIVALSLEVINAFIMNALFFKENQADLWNIISGCFRNTRLSFAIMATAGTLLCTPIYAFSTGNKF